MIVTAIAVAGSTPHRKLSPLLIWSAPRPSEVALPNSVAKIARMSIDLADRPVHAVAEQRVEAPS